MTFKEILDKWIEDSTEGIIDSGGYILGDWPWLYERNTNKQNEIEIAFFGGALHSPIQVSKEELIESGVFAMTHRGLEDYSDEYIRKRMIHSKYCYYRILRENLYIGKDDDI